MARKPQQLINYHTGSASSMPQSGDVQFGEIVVRHNATEPQLLIKVSEGTQGTDEYKEYFVPFISSGKISTEIESAIVNAKGTIDSDISGLRDSINAVSATVTSDYALSANTREEINGAVSDLIGESTDGATANTIYGAKAYADSQDEALSGRIVSYIESSVTTDLTNVKAAVSDLKSFSGKVESDYATKAYADSAATTAVETVVGTTADTKDANTVYGAKAYTDDAVKTLSGNVETALNSKVDDITDKIDAVDTRVTSLSGTVSAFSSSVATYVDERLSTVYSYKGSVATYGALPTTGLKNGDVYNVEGARGEIGDADYIPAGTNYAWVADANEEGGGHWDPLAGIVDLSSYAKTSVTDALGTRVTALESSDERNSGKITALSGSLIALSAKVESDYATTSSVDEKIGSASAAAVTSAYTASTAYTNAEIEKLSGITSAYVETAISDVESEVSDIKRDYATKVYADSAATAAKTDVLGPANATSADTETLRGLKAYSDEKDAELRTEISGLLDSFSGAMSGDFTSVQQEITNLTSRVAANEDKFTSSAATWNSALQHGELGTVSETTAGNGVTIQSGARLKDDGTNKKLVLDLSNLIIDCGDF